VWLLLPAGPIRSVIVFGHGWKQAPPSASDPWVGQFRPWLDHLVAGGSVVIFPRYQLGGDAAGAERVAAYRRGLQLGFARLGRPAVPVVAVGYSYGASLAFYYAANAASWGLPPVAAVDAVFPAGTIPGAALPAPPPSLRALIEVGDRDTVAGAPDASPFWAWLANKPARLKRYRTVHSSGSFVAVHAAPKGTSLEARQAFWAPLDALIATVRLR
jgi:dienelactone hydrolase